MKEEIALTKKGITTTAGLANPSGVGGNRCVNNARNNIEQIKMEMPFPIRIKFRCIIYDVLSGH